MKLNSLPTSNNDFMCVCVCVWHHCLNDAKKMTNEMYGLISINHSLQSAFFFIQNKKRMKWTKRGESRERTKCDTITSFFSFKETFFYNFSIAIKIETCECTKASSVMLCFVIERVKIVVFYVYHFVFKFYSLCDQHSFFFFARLAKQTFKIVYVAKWNTCDTSIFFGSSLSPNSTQH